MKQTFRTFTDDDLRALREICGAERVVPRDRIGEDYSHDELSGIRRFPDVLVHAVMDALLGAAGLQCPHR